MGKRAKGRNAEDPLRRSKSWQNDSPIEPWEVCSRGSVSSLITLANEQEKKVRRKIKLNV